MDTEADILEHKMNEVAGFVTAGGQSSRMGKDKAWLELDGRPMIEHVIAALQAVTTSVAIVANDPEYARLGFPVFPDLQRGVGPLEAIRTTLRNSNTARTFLVGCDLPFVSPELFKVLISIEDCANYDAIVPLSADQKLEPLCAIYCKRALVAVEGLIASGERKVSSLFDLVPTRFVRFEELRHLAGSGVFFENINTPADYARVVATFKRDLKSSSDSPNPM